MQHVRRGIAITVCLLTASATLAACHDDQDVSTFRVVRGPRMDAYRADDWTDLPPSPVGDWPRYNWVWLADGSGFVHAGAARVDGDGKISTTSAAAYFSFADRRYTTLPDIPVKSGVGAAGGAWVDDTLVIVGQDCPPSPGESSSGVEFCGNGGMGSKVVLTYRRDGSAWVRHDVPDWMQEYRYGAPEVLGVRDGKVLVASGHVPAHIGAFDPVSGAWSKLPNAPGVATTTTAPSATSTSPGPTQTTTSVIDPANPPTAVPYVPPPKLCMVDGEIVAWVIAGPWPAVPPASSGPAHDAYKNEWWRLDGDTWVSVPPVVTGGVDSAVCSRHGVYVARLLGSSVAYHELDYVDPIKGTAVTVQGTIDSLIDGTEASPFGDLLQLPASYAVGAVPTTTSTPAGPANSPTTLPDPYQPHLRYATPERVVVTAISTSDALVVGRYVIRQNDLWDGGASGDQRPVPQILRLDG